MDLAHGVNTAHAQVAHFSFHESEEFDPYGTPAKFWHYIIDVRKGAKRASVVRVRADAIDVITNKFAIRARCGDVKIAGGFLAGISLHIGIERYALLIKSDLSPV